MNGLFRTPAIPHPWQLKCHPNGALYFYSNELKVVTDEDIRDPQIYQSVMHRSSLYPLSELEDGMEVHLHSSSIEAHSSFNMAINHQLCLASYNLNEIYKLDADERTSEQAYIKFDLYSCDYYNFKITDNDVAIGITFEVTQHTPRHPSLLCKKLWIL